MQNLGDQVTKTWEAYGDKAIVFYQHLEPFDKAQENLSKLIAQQVTECNTKFQLETTEAFLTFFLKSVFKTRIKMEKFKKFDGDKKFALKLDDVVSKIVAGNYKKILIPEYVDILLKIGILYDRLGYNSPERLKIRTPMQSDLELPGTTTPEEMETIPITEGIFGED